MLEAAGWRFFNTAAGKANITLEPNVKLTLAQIDEMGNDFETTSKGYIDFLLLDEKGFPLVVLEAKAEDKNPLIGKEQSRKYARSQNCRFVILSNGSLHYLWDLARGNPHLITRFPAPDSIKGNARRVLFLVDRLELEEQANKAFIFLLKNDYKSVIYKESCDDWRKAEIVVTTVQSLLFNNKYQQLFSPTDFDLVISDEAHRSIGGNARAVFEYFVGYKLGLTATPKDYLKKFDAAKPSTRDPREQERRLLLDTYRTFGCETGEPTFRYSLLDGVREGFLINPLVVDARTGVTTQLLSDIGYAAVVISDAPDSERTSEQQFKQRSFKRSFSPNPPTSCFAKLCSRTACATPSAASLAKPWCLPSAKITPPRSRKS